jgi:hypothetical protein
MRRLVAAVGSILLSYVRATVRVHETLDFADEVFGRATKLPKQLFYAIGATNRLEKMSFLDTPAAAR